MSRRVASQMQFPGVETPARRPLPIPSLGEPVTRRGFLQRALGWITAAILATIGVPAAVMAVSPALRKSKSEWSPIARLGEPGPGEADLSQIGEPILADFKIVRGDAYIAPRLEQVPVYVINRGDGKFTVYDTRCTHLGCPITWDTKERTFLCPCHNGVFDMEGKVASGPPPRPLDQYEAKVDGGVLYAGAAVKGGAGA